MPEIKPLKGIRYNPEKVENLSEVICQPYDQITDEMERQYKKRNPYNFVRMVLTKYAEGHDRAKEYAEAKKSLDQWRQENVFIQDEKDTIYPYWQEFSIGDKTYERKGFVCLVRLEQLGKGSILPHEKTLAKPKEDRLNLLRITRKDLEPVFLLYTDPEDQVNKLLEKTCTKEPAMVQVKDDRSVVHKLWRIDDPKPIKKITSALQDSILVIADGHHRYETAYDYRQELKEIDDQHPANYKLITLVNIEDPGLIILPTHRLIKGVGDFNLTSFLERTSAYFEIKKADRNNIAEQITSQKSGTFGFYSRQTAYILQLKSTKIMSEVLADRSKAYRGLDVVILHSLLIERVLGIEPEHIEDHVRYERGSRETMRRVDSGEFEFCFLMNPTRPEQVKEVAGHRERMPQKSTDFFPKLVSGLVFYDLG